jgi:hypothetical protein
VNNPDKSSKNIFPKMNINNEKNEKNEKDLFVVRKKQMRNNFTKGFFDQRNINDKMKLEKETEKAEKEHKYFNQKDLHINKIIELMIINLSNLKNILEIVLN